MRLLTTTALPFAALLFSPITAPAQTVVSAKALPQSISIQVAFVTVNSDDLDALGINFNARLLPGSPETYLSCAEGNSVPQIYQRLMRTANVDSHVVTLTPIEVSDNVPAVFTVNAQVPASAASSAAKQQSSFPQLTEALQIHGGITLIPQIVSGTLMRLDMLSPLGSDQKVPLYCIPSGQQIVINAAVNKVQHLTGSFQLKSGDGRNKVSHTTELLIFITPTILGTSIDGTAITVKP